MEDGKIVRCFYDEIFADHTKDIVYDDLKQFYRQSKYFSTTYEDPFPSGWDRHAWLVCFKDQSDAINKKVCETQDMFDITGLPCVEGPDMAWCGTSPTRTMWHSSPTATPPPVLSPGPALPCGTTICAWPRSSTTRWSRTAP
mgnify:FL=1